MKTTVVIPNYNGKKYLSDCLKSLEAAEKERPAVIVVDNGSSDGSAQEAREMFPWIRLIRFPENRGFDAAVNEGIRESRTPYVFLLCGRAASARWRRAWNGRRSCFPFPHAWWI